MGPLNHVFPLCRLFERGLAYVGVDYLSHVLWDKYLSFRASGESQVPVADLYSRILRIPLKKLDDYHTRWVEELGALT